MAGYIGSKASVVSSGAERKKVFAITTSTTSLTGLAYTVNQVHVFHNGIRLVDGTDYTATDGTTITLTNAAADGDEVVVVSYAAFQTSDTVSASAGGTFSNAVTIDADGATALTVDRATSDGTIIDVQKDGSTVGSIGVDTGDLHIHSTTSGHAGLRFGNGRYQPTDNAGAVVDDTIDIGVSSSRYKDLYLSGGVYLGGTGSANKLDDYEVGTWTPIFDASAGTTTVSSYDYQKGNYIKIGSLVYVFFDFGGTISSATGNAAMSGFPFAPASDTYNSVQLRSHNCLPANPSTYLGFTGYWNGTEYVFQLVTSTGSETAFGAFTTGGSRRCNGYLIYKTDA